MLQLSAFTTTISTPPAFSWQTVPLYWYSANPKGDFEADTAAYAATFPIVVPNGNHKRFVAPAAMNETGKLLDAALQLKALNTSSTVLFYMNTMMDWSQYDVHRWIGSNHPEWWVQNDREEPVCLDAQPLFNLTIPAVRDHWLGVVTKALAAAPNATYGGIFADRANKLPKGNSVQPGPGQTTQNGIYTFDSDPDSCTCESDGSPPFKYSKDAYAAWADGHSVLVQDAQKHVHNVDPTNAIVIANNNASGVSGRQFERWANKDFDGDTIASDIEELEAAGQASPPTVSLVHGGEPCDDAALALSLSAFLIGAGTRAYFACSDGWAVNDGWSKEQRPAEYDYPLGAPLGLAKRTVDGQTTTYTREFASGTKVSLALSFGAISDGDACIQWSNGETTGC